MTYYRLVDEVIEEYRLSPVGILEGGDTFGEWLYLTSLKHSYVRIPMMWTIYIKAIEIKGEF